MDKDKVYKAAKAVYLELPPAAADEISQMFYELLAEVERLEKEQEIHYNNGYNDGCRTHQQFYVDR